MSRAWFALAVAGLLGLFYVGFGLHFGSTSGAALGQEAKSKGGGGPLPPELAPIARLKWETLAAPSLRGTPPPQIQRTKIPGGWLVETMRRGGESGSGSGLAFVPDPEHKWDGNSLP